jgi:hypothetical protein
MRWFASTAHDVVEALRILLELDINRGGATILADQRLYCGLAASSTLIASASARVTGYMIEQPHERRGHRRCRRS